MNHSNRHRTEKEACSLVNLNDKGIKDQGHSRVSVLMNFQISNEIWLNLISARWQRLWSFW